MNQILSIKRDVERNELLAAFRRITVKAGPFGKDDFGDVFYASIKPIYGCDKFVLTIYRHFSYEPEYISVCSFKDGLKKLRLFTNF